MSDAAAEKLVGTTLAGKYRVVQLLRGGDLANVYLAEMLTLRPAPAAASGPVTPRIGRAARLALKVLREELAADRAVVKRFERGAVAAARIVHPNVVRTAELERLPNGLPLSAMELLIGLDLADALAYSGHLDTTRALRIAAGAAAGLGAIHAAGLVHLDVKPENVFLVHEPDGREGVKIVDFGHATPAFGQPGWRSETPRPEAPRAGAAGPSLPGTPGYMAPELAQGAPPAPAMDVYSLGVVLGEMLTGAVPGSSRAAVAPVPSRLARVLERATAPDPARRYPSMEALRAELMAIAEETPAGHAS